MNQAILKILDEMIEEEKKENTLVCAYTAYRLRELKSKISSLPSDTQWIDQEDDWLS